MTTLTQSQPFCARTYQAAAETANFVGRQFQFVGSGLWGITQKTSQAVKNAFVWVSGYVGEGYRGVASFASRNWQAVSTQFSQNPALCVTVGALLGAAFAIGYHAGSRPDTTPPRSRTEMSPPTADMAPPSIDPLVFTGPYRSMPSSGFEAGGHPMGETGPMDIGVSLRGENTGGSSGIEGSTNPQMPSGTTRLDTQEFAPTTLPSQTATGGLNTGGPTNENPTTSGE